MYEEDEGNGGLMPRKAGIRPLIWAPSAGGRESARYPQGAFEVSIVVEAFPTNHLLTAKTEHCPYTHPPTTHICTSSCILLSRVARTLSNTEEWEVNTTRGEEMRENNGTSGFFSPR